MKRNKSKQVEKYEKEYEHIRALNISEEEIRQTEQRISIDKVKERAQEKVHEHKNIGLCLVKKPSVKIGSKRKKLLVLAATLLLGGTTIASSMGSFEEVFGLNNIPNKKMIQTIGKSDTHSGITMKVKESYLSEDKLVTILELVKEDGSTFARNTEVGRILGVYDNEIIPFWWGNKYELSKDGKVLTYTVTEHVWADTDLLDEKYTLKAENLVKREWKRVQSQVNLEKIYNKAYYETERVGIENSITNHEQFTEIYEEFSQQVESADVKLCEEIPNTYVEGIVRINDIYYLVVKEDKVEPWSQSNLECVELIHKEKGHTYGQTLVSADDESTRYLGGSIKYIYLEEDVRASFISLTNEDEKTIVNEWEDLIVEVTYNDVEVLSEGIWETEVHIQKEDDTLWSKEVNEIIQDRHKTYEIHNIKVSPTGVTIVTEVLDISRETLRHEYPSEAMDVVIENMDGSKTYTRYQLGASGIEGEVDEIYFGYVGSEGSSDEVFLDIGNIKAVEILINKEKIISIEK